MKFRKLTADDIEVKVKQVKQNGVICLLYKTSRTDMDLLDETVGPMNWESDYKEIKGNLYAGIGVRESEEKPFVWKWDCGIESRADGEGNQKKGEASDAFKRAGFKWGIGRELYTSPFIFIRSDLCRIEGNKCYDKFSVEKIVYDDNGRVAGLSIRNDSIKKRAFVWQASNSEK